MKKLIIIITLIIMSPINILAYSTKIIPGGENIGIEINTKGLVVVGFYKVNGKYIGKNNLKIGDTILEIEGKEISTINEMSKIIDENIKNGEINIKIKRNNIEKETKLTLIKDGEIYKTGLYIKEKVTGIGTLTYIDPKTKIYGALGHNIIMNETENRIEIKEGNIYESYVNGIDRSTNGNVGSKNATITYSNRIGTIEKNIKTGIYGIYNTDLPNKELIEVSEFNEIEIGKAKILTTLNGTKIEEYEIEITNINQNNINTNKAISIKITDPRLLETSGGIVQGMSGSPIIQNNKIIGAVTHVLVDDVTNGYGIFIRTMLEEGER